MTNSIWGDPENYCTHWWAPDSKTYGPGTPQRDYMDWFMRTPKGTAVQIALAAILGLPDDASAEAVMAAAYLRLKGE